LHVVVCTKETPDTAAKVELDADGNVTWGDTPVVLNPWDEYSVEEGLLLKEAHGGTCTVLAMGGESTKEALKHAVAMGCDEAILVSDPAFENADTLVTSHVLAKSIEKMGDVDLAIFGKQAIDGDTGQTAVQVGRRLVWNTLTYVVNIVEIDFDAKTIKVERLLEEGKQVCESKLPAVISTVKDLNEPRYPSFMGIRKAAGMDIPTWSADEIGADGGVAAKVQWPEISAPPAREGEVEIIEGETPAEIATTLADKLIGEKVI
jgi:electron transfer flavoprotein beta subunit